MSAGRWQSLHSALQELWDGNDVTATLDQIYTTEPDLLHSVLPQLTLYLLHSAARLLPGTDPAAAALERQLLSICSSSLPFALELCWLLRAQPLPPPEPAGGTPSLSRRSTAQSAPAAADDDPPLLASPASPPWPAPTSTAAVASPLRPLQAHAPHAQQHARWPSGGRPVSPSQQLQQAHARVDYVAALLGRIEEAVRRVEQYMDEEQRFEAQLLAAMTDEQLIAGMTAEEEWAPEPWSAATPRTPMGGSSAGSPAAAPDRTELAERQLAALMEMGYHAAQVANYCDGETPLELLIEQIALGDPASDAPQSGEAREAAEASPPSTPRLSSVRRLGAAAQKVWKAKTSSRPASAREPGRSF